MHTSVYEQLPQSHANTVLVCESGDCRMRGVAFAIINCEHQHLFWYRLGKGIPKEGGERKATIESFRGLKLLHQILKEIGGFSSKLAQNLAQI